MVSTVSDTQIAKASSTNQVTYLQEVAKKICQEALAETYAQLAPAEQAFQPDNSSNIAILDVNLVTPESVVRGTGLANLLSSIASR